MPIPLLLLRRKLSLLRLENRHTRWVLALFVLAAIAGLAVLYAATRSEKAETVASRAPVHGCPVSTPNVSKTAGRNVGSAVYGENGIFIDLGGKSTIVAMDSRHPQPSGTMTGQAKPDGAIYAKFLWVRDASAKGTMRVTGERLDGDSAPLRAQINQTYPDIAPSDLIFPEPGCWKIHASSGSASATITMFVIRPAGVKVARSR